MMRIFCTRMANESATEFAKRRYKVIADNGLEGLEKDVYSVASGTIYYEKDGPAVAYVSDVNTGEKAKGPPKTKKEKPDALFG